VKPVAGIPIAPGYAIGCAFVYLPPSMDNVPEETLDEGRLDAEVERMRIALQRTGDGLQAIRTCVATEIDEETAKIFDGHLYFITDPEFQHKLFSSIKNDRLSSELAVKVEIKQFINQLSFLKNDYIRERIMDFEDVGNQLLRNLRHDAPHHPLKELPEGTIVLAKELLPSESVNMDREHVVGIVTEQGGSTSHTAILARAMGIPCIVGISNATDPDVNGKTVLIDGSKGRVTIDPSEWQAREFKKTQRSFQESEAYLRQRERHACRLKGGTSIQLMGNINCLADMPLIEKHNLEGVGLFRTEIVFLGTPHIPGLAAQQKIYAEAAACVAPRPLIIRTFDFSTDKHPDFLDKKLLGTGQRGVGWALMEKRMINTQLHAILRAHHEYRNIRILLPMVASKQQVFEIMKILDELAAKEKLEIPPVGAMIETPLAVFSLQDILPQVSFSSIGCNDLAQYMLGIERAINTVALHDWVLEPTLLRTFETIFKTARQLNQPVNVCGLAASDPLLATILVGLGARELSVDPAYAPGVRYTLRHMGLRDAKSIANLALEGKPKEAVLAALYKRIPNAPLALRF